jgi:hemoglobin/transferrin/lactoferrin receptor protein
MRGFLKMSAAGAAMAGVAAAGFASTAAAAEAAMPVQMAELAPAAPPGSASSGALADDARPVQLARVETVTVTAMRTAQPIDTVPVTVSVITDADIEANLYTDIKDLVRYEPGVSVRSSPSRFTAAGASTGRDGDSGFNIRGLEGNRVLMLIDGVRVPDAFSFGPQAAGRGDYVDLDLLKSVEILRGPASALYGSDGVAGAVSFITKDPQDLLRAGEDTAARGTFTYASADSSFNEGLTLAGRSGDWSALVAYSRRDGHELDNVGSNESLNILRTAPNPQGYDSNDVLGRVVYQPSEANRFRLTAEHFDRDISTEVYSARAVPPLASTSVIDLTTLDTTRRDRIGLDHTYTGGGFVDRAFWAVYYQAAATRQFSAEDRNTAADRTRDSTFDNRVFGFNAQLDSSFQWGISSHHLTYGGDYSLTRQDGLRTGTVPPAGESFPTRAFPNTDYALGGLYVQDQISFWDERLVVSPAVRFDSYSLDPRADALYTGTFASQSDSHVSPKIGAVFWLTHEIGAFANYANGFKAPAPSQVNNGFANLLVNYKSIPNPNLAAETSNTFEGGLRLRDVAAADADWTASVTGFTGRYKNFIDQVQLGGSFTPADPGIFQYVNLSDVDIGGVEGRVAAQWEMGLGAFAAASYSRGDQRTGGVKTALASIDPWKLVAGLSYRDASDRFGGQLFVTHSGGEPLSRTGTVCTPGCYVPPAFTTLDVTAYWNVTDAAVLRLGLFNITDETYIWWNDVRGLAANSPVIDAYTQPGRNVSFSLTYRL